MSTDSLPSSIRVPIMVAVIALVHDPRCIWSVTRIGSGEPILRIPSAPIAASLFPVGSRRSGPASGARREPERVPG